ncbi:hypothetical protein EDC01DRAFT_645965 [Geopyxis carbonaria]|nr:hypothetical protein EDC01DRAFT_645965 [Geopyxis carbonaria]
MTAGFFFSFSFSFSSCTRTVACPAPSRPRSRFLGSGACTASSSSSEHRLISIFLRFAGEDTAEAGTGRNVMVSGDADCCDSSIARCSCAASSESSMGEGERPDGLRAG